PPRPATPSFAPDFDNEPPFESQYDYAPERSGRTPPFLVTTGAVAAALAVVAAVFLWPRPDVQPADSATPSTPAPAQHTTEPTRETTSRPAPATEAHPATRPLPPPPPRPSAQPTTPPTSEQPQTTTRPPDTTTEAPTSVPTRPTQPSSPAQSPPGA